MPGSDLESPFLYELPFTGESDPEAGPYPRVELQASGIAGIDDRTDVADTTIPPYRWICSIAYEAGTQTLDGGTGCLISNRHVLTAAHVIQKKATAPTAHSVYVYPGRHLRGDLGRVPVARARVSPTPFDFGLITLESPVDAALQWWGHPSSRAVWWSEAVIPLRQIVMSGIPISTAGYPSARDRQRRIMVESTSGGTVPQHFGGSFLHTADTTEGQSGSPIWTLHNGVYVLIGIVTSYSTSGQFGSFVQVMQQQVNRWMAEDASQPERRIALEIPYRWVCRLEVRDNDLRRTVGYGTGLLISNRHVLTSAQVIHGFSRDRRKYSVHVTPGYEFGREPFGSTTASKARVSPKFSPESRDGSADYGLLTLSRSIGSATFASIKKAALGYWGGASHELVKSAADWSGKRASIAAFSRSSGGAAYHKLRQGSGDIVGLQRGQILHKASSKLDAPGAPIWVEAGKRSLLAGLASSVFSKDSDVNWGCYLSQETLSNLMQWVNEDYEKREFEAGDRFSQDELESVLAAPDTEGSDGT